MKASELRIGNFLELNSLTDGHKAYIEVGLFHLNEIGKTIKYKYDPIPLTEEWLLKFGFEKETIFKTMKFIFNNFFIVSITARGIIYVNLKNNTFRIDIKHVHQLQNLYFALTGEELEIR